MKKTNLKVFRGLKEIESNLPLDLWHKIFSESESANVFNHPSIVLNWYRTFTSIRANQPLIIFGSVSDRYLILPMEIVRHSWRNMKSRILVGIGGSYNIDFQDPLVSGKVMTISERNLFWDTIFTFIRNSVPECDQITCFRLRPLFVDDTHTFLCSDVSPYLDLKEFKNLDDVLLKCSVKHRGDVKRQIRRLSEKNRPTIHRYASNERESALEELKRFFSAYAKEWTPRGNNAYATEQEQLFLRNIVNDMLKTQLLHFSVLYCGEDPINWHLGFLHNGRFYYYKPTYDIAWHNFSPGKIHVALLIEECIKNNIRYFDFLYGNEPYKYDWMPIEEKLYCIKRWNGHSLRRILYENIRPPYQYMKLKMNNWGRLI